MPYEIEFTDEFEGWWDGLSEAEQDDVAATVELLKDRGPMLPYPYSSDIKSSKHGNMRELRVQHAGNPYRVFYAFDPRRTAILLIGGNKAGDDRIWYKRFVPIADNLYDVYIQELKDEGKIQ